MSVNKQQYRKMKQTMISMGNPVYGTIALFKREPAEEILKYSSALCRDGFFRNGVIGKCYPATVADMGNCGNMPPFLSLEKTLEWYVLALCAESEKINEFLGLRKEFDYAFLNGQYDRCLHLLEASRKQFGRSFWEIKNQIAVLNEKEGFESQRKYSDSVISEMQKGSVDAYQVYYYSKQCERNISVGSFLNALARDYDRFTKKAGFDITCKYAYFKASGNFLDIGENGWLVEGKTIQAFLYLDDKYGLIDRYISLIDIATNIFVYGPDELRQMFIPYIAKMSQFVSDPVFNNIVFQWENHHCCFYAAENDRICEAFDLYSIGNYEASLQITKTLLLEDVANFSLVELYAKCCVYLQDYIPITDAKSLINTVLRKLNQLYTRTGDARDIQTDLMKLLYTHLHTNWAHELLLILEKFNSRLMVLEECKTTSYYSAISTPDIIFTFDAAFLDDFLKTATEIFCSSISTKLAIAMRTNDINLLEHLALETTRKEKYKARLLLETSPGEALVILDQLRESCCVIGAIMLEIDALRVRAYLSMDNLLRAIEIFVPAFCKNSNFIYAGAIDRIFNEIKAGTNNVSQSILTPIICSLYFNYYTNHNDMDDIVLSACYEDYLDTCGVDKPSGLLSNPPVGVNADMLNRFLAEVCVPNVMARSLAFESEDDILRERNIICEALSVRDEENYNKYMEEIRRHTNTLLVRLAKREIDNGKVYIDIEGIRTQLLQDVCEQFERYVDYRQNDLEEYIFAIVNDISQSSSTPIYLYKPRKQTGLLEEAVKKIRDIFTADNKYGLDGTLSVRIRHGTLESQLRACFEKHNLITTKSVDGIYNPNQHWHNAKHKTVETEAKIQEIFSSFSANIDKQIAYIKNELIQIRTEEKNPKGVFDFTIDGNLISVIDAQMNWINSYQKFEAHIMDRMLDITNACLERMRDLLNCEINDTFQQMLRDLETSLQKYNTLLNFQALRDQIAKARTDISAELKTIAEWFRRTQSDDFRDYDLSLAAQLSLQTFQHSHPSCKLHCSYDDIDKSIELKGRTLLSVVDIFIILLDNVMKHSGVASNASVQISAKRQDSAVVLSVRNPVKTGTISSARLREITEQLSNWENSDYTRREGGSGLHKVKKILSVDLQCNNTINLSCDDDTFIVDIRAELGGVLR